MESDHPSEKIDGIDLSAVFPQKLPTATIRQRFTEMGFAIPTQGSQR